MRWLALSFMLVIAGCTRESCETCSSEHGLQSPKFEFLGVTGFLLHWRGEGLLFDPFFSRPTIPELFWMTPDKKVIDERMPKATDVTMLLVGHAHFDHMLDVAWVMQKHTPEAKVYGSRTAGHILRAEIAADRIVNAEPRMARLYNDSDARTVALPCDAGWFYSRHRAFRAMPIESNHAPNATGVDLMGGEYKQDLTSLPKAFWNWKEGQTLAWLVDLLDEEGKTVYRIHYQDSASSAPYGIPPDLGDNQRVDIEILPVASWSQVHGKGYPQALLELTQPRLVILAHWEDFFGGNPDDPKILRAEKDEPGMVNITKEKVPKGSVVVMPKPFSEIALPAIERDDVERRGNARAYCQISSVTAPSLFQ